jgi:hypothetical protein
MPNGVNEHAPIILPPAELKKQWNKIRFVGLYEDKDEPEKTQLFYLERRPVHHGFWLIRPEEPALDLAFVTTIETHHYPYTGRPDPSIEEYLSQIPQELIDEVDVVEVFCTDSIYLVDSWKLKTRLYKSLNKRTC